MTDKDTFYVIDGSSYIYRAFYGIRGLSNSEGLPTNALYGFTQMLQTLLEDADPEYVAVALDAFEADEKTFRKEMYEEYKAHRPEMPEDLKTQIPYFDKIIESLHIPVLKEPGLEADDLIAAATECARQQQLEVCIVSADKDLMQLLGPDVWMWDTMRDKEYKPEDVRDRFRVEPEQVKYVLALAGDSSDNIPGVPGIGEKTGGNLISEFGDLETLLDNIDKVGGKKRPKNLREHQDQVRLSLKLVTLKQDCDIDFSLDRFQLTPPNIEEVRELFTELEFRKPFQTIKSWMEERGWLEPAQQTLSLGDDSDGPLNTDTFENTDKDYRGIFTEDELQEAIEACREAEQFALDLETTSLEPLDAVIVGVSLSWEPGQAVYIPCGHRNIENGKQLEKNLVLDKLKPLIEDDTPKVVGQHLKYEWVVLQNYDIELNGIAWDTMLMSYLIDPGRRSHSLDALADEHLSYQAIAYDDVIEDDDENFASVDMERAIPYACEDADLALQLAVEMQPELEEGNLVELHDDMEVPLIPILGQMERRGIAIDRDILQELSDEFESELDGIKAEIAEYAGEEVNPNSPKQLREVLFDKLDLPVKKRTKTGPSTAKSVLEQLTDKHPLPGLILDYRSFAKLKNTYVDALPELIRSETGRIHTDFNQTVTSTGRLSSSNPNLQNIPIRDPRGRQIRRAFTPADGYKLLGADYSQVELRVLAHLAEDPKLIEAFKSGKDIHTLTASELFEIPEDEVDSDQRDAGKTINYGVLYGMGPNRLARDLDISRSRAKEHIDQYFDRYDHIKAYFDGVVEDATETGYATTLYGRRRRLPGLRQKGRQRAFAERAAINAPIQGTAADIMKDAMLEVDEAIRESDLPAHMLLQVHDELIFEIDEDKIDEASRLIRQKMEGVVDLAVPLEIDIGIGDNWLEAK
jgi:DNA polymerase-1